MYRVPRIATCTLLVILAGACTSSSADPRAVATVDGVTFGYREFGLTDEQFNDYVTGVQEHIADCMAGAGFEFVPADVEQIELAQKHVRTQPGYDRRTYKERWGLGVTTRFDNPVKEVELGEQNLAYYQTLSEADRVAYDRTLFGKDTDATFTFMFDEEDFERRGGCIKKGIDAVFPPHMLKENFVNPKDVLVERDPRIIKAEQNWVTCMEERGFEGYTDQDEFIEEYEEIMDELIGELDPYNLPPGKAKRLKEIQEYEIAFSLADLDCQILHTDDAYTEVEIEIFGRAVSV